MLDHPRGSMANPNMLPSKAPRIRTIPIKAGSAWQSTGGSQILLWSLLRRQIPLHVIFKISCSAILTHSMVHIADISIRCAGKSAHRRAHWLEKVRKLPSTPYHTTRNGNPRVPWASTFARLKSMHGTPTTNSCSEESIAVLQRSASISSTACGPSGSAWHHGHLPAPLPSRLWTRAALAPFSRCMRVCVVFGSSGRNLPMRTWLRICLWRSKLSTCVWHVPHIIALRRMLRITMELRCCCRARTGLMNWIATCSGAGSRCENLWCDRSSATPWKKSVNMHRLNPRCSGRCPMEWYGRKTGRVMQSYCLYALTTLPTLPLSRENLSK